MNTRHRLPLLAAALLLAACDNTQQMTPTPHSSVTPARGIAPVPVYTADVLPEAAPGEHKQRLKELSPEEREALARALVRSHNWGHTQQQHDALGKRLWQGKVSFIQVEKSILRATRLPREASPEMRQALELALQEDESLHDWGLILDFVPLVTRNYLTRHPQDARAWDFLTFLCRLSDGEAIYSTSVVQEVQDAGLEQFEEGRQFLYAHRE